MSNEIRQICVISVFPEIVNDFIQYGVLKRGQDKSLINIKSIKDSKSKYY